jgi:hypothetical protein
LRVKGQFPIGVAFGDFVNLGVCDEPLRRLSPRTAQVTPDLAFAKRLMAFRARSSFVYRSEMVFDFVDVSQ